jgi:hypothetical protein
LELVSLIREPGFSARGGLCVDRADADENANNSVIHPIEVIDDCIDVVVDTLSRLQALSVVCFDEKVIVLVE